ncbi:hypothetical protein QC763_122910 [Podospora pseudopauciseta]|uniref:Tafazzin n=1 Tax=Podospora pseudopauciseta TaxID=2093780 RepID=A0ABR0I2V6_9PEZI|nr:hypothetical protein QC763_122910 [Podospora pseudopauciseta]
MPKKRHQKQYSKPQSTAPASLSSSTAASRHNSHHDDQQQNRSVNELLADLRRAGLRDGGSSQIRPAEAFVQPTVPPAIRQILQLPETPAPPPRRPVRVDATGRRLPPGPAPPRSWVSRPAGSGLYSDPRTLIEFGGAQNYAQRPLPGMVLPAKGSLMDLVLKGFARTWDWQVEYCRYILYELPTRVRGALLAYIGLYSEKGLTLQDMRAILLPPPPVVYEDDEDSHYEQERQRGFLPPGVVNDDFSCLDLSWSLGRSLKIRELSDFLYPPQAAAVVSTADPKDSWDAPDDEPTLEPSIPAALLPNLTRLSLALDPEHAHNVSWRHLLSFATHMPNLTHLSLAFWPEPSLTPNAKLATMVTAQGQVVQYGATGPYSHSLDNDWTEAIMVLNRLSKSLYRLEHLDLTGCGLWASALWSKSGHDMVDWVGAWGKVERIVMYAGYKLGEEAGSSERARYEMVTENARRVERHVRGRRAEKGMGKRGIVVETDEEGKE